MFPEGIQWGFRGRTRESKDEKETSGTSGGKFWLILLGFGAISTYFARKRLMVYIKSKEKAALAKSEFYREMLRVLARQGFIRKEGETPYEFAGRVQSVLGSSPESKSIKNAINFLTDIFYEVRFRGDSLKPAQVSKIDAFLKEVKQLQTASK